MSSVRCPFCGCDRIELVSPWGGQLITSLVRCEGCNTHFEALREAVGLGGEAVGLGGEAVGLGGEAEGPSAR